MLSLIIRALLDDEIYLRTLNRTDLTDYRAIVIPDFSNQDLLRSMPARSTTISAAAAS